MYNNPYFNNYNTQPSLDRINAQINELEKMKEQIQKPVPQPTNLTQNFQLAPNNQEVIRYANSMEEVQRNVVICDTPYFSKDMSVVWIKNTKGEVKTYELNEIVPKDEKDIQIELLQSQINELRKEMKENEQSYSNVITTEIATDTSRNDTTNGTATKKDKSSSVQGISTSKKR